MYTRLYMHSPPLLSLPFPYPSFFLQPANGSTLLLHLKLIYKYNSSINRKLVIVILPPIQSYPSRSSSSPPEEMRERELEGYGEEFRLTLLNPFLSPLHPPSPIHLSSILFIACITFSSEKFTYNNNHQALYY